MRESRRTEILTAGVLVAPFVAIYGWLFVYPTIQMVRLSFTDAPLIGAGNWIGLDNYYQLFKDRVFGTAVWNTLYFVVLTVVPGTAAALSIALMVSRLRGWTQSIILAAFFLPYVLPVTVVYVIWDWMFNVQYGVLQYILDTDHGAAGQCLAAAALAPADGGPDHRVVDQWPVYPPLPRGTEEHPRRNLRSGRAGRRQSLAGLPEHHLAADLAGHRALPDHPAHPADENLRSGLPVLDGRPHAGDHGPRPVHLRPGASCTTRAATAATIAVALFVIVIALSVLQFQALRARGQQ